MNATRIGTTSRMPESRTSSTACNTRPMNSARQASHTVACALCAAIAGVHAQQVEDPFAPLLLESRPLSTRLQTDYAGMLELGLAYTSDPSFMFGQYNGLNDDGATLIGKLTPAGAVITDS